MIIQHFSIFFFIYLNPCFGVSSACVLSNVLHKWIVCKILFIVRHSLNMFTHRKHVHSSVFFLSIFWCKQFFATFPPWTILLISFFFCVPSFSPLRISVFCVFLFHFSICIQHFIWQRLIRIVQSSRCFFFAPFELLLWNYPCDLDGEAIHQRVMLLETLKSNAFHKIIPQHSHWTGTAK